MKRVSVLLAVHNGAPFVASAIQSVIEQTYPHWELIVVSNGSTDDTVRIAECSSALDPRVSVVAVPHKGKNAAYNVAYKRSTGDFICFFAADDKLPENSLTERLNALQGKAASAYSTCCLKTFSANPRYDGIVFPRNANRANYSGGSLFFSRWLAGQLFPLPETQPNEDTWTALHLRAFGAGHHIPKPLYLYRLHEDNSYGYTMTFERKREEYLQRMHAYSLFYDKHRGERSRFITHEVIPFLKGLAAAKERNVLGILRVRGLELGSKLLLVFYCSKVLYKLRHRFFKGLSAGIWSGRRGE